MNIPFVLRNLMHKTTQHRRGGIPGFALISRNGMWPDPVKHEKSISVLEAIGNKAMFPAIKNGQKSKVPLHEAPQTSSHIINRITDLQPAQSLNTHRKILYMRENKDSPAFKQTTNYNASGTSNLHYEEDRVKSPLRDLH